MAKQPATRSESQEEADLGLETIKIRLGSPVSSVYHGASPGLRNLLREAFLDHLCWVRHRNVPEPALTGP